MTAFSWVGTNFTLGGEYTKTTDAANTPTWYYNSWTTGLSSQGLSWSSTDDGGTVVSTSTAPKFNGWNHNFALSSEGQLFLYRTVDISTGTTWVSAPSGATFQYRNRVIGPPVPPAPSLAFSWAFDQDSAISSYAHTWDANYYYFKGSYAYYSGGGTPGSVALKMGRNDITFAVQSNSTATHMETAALDESTWTATNKYDYGSVATSGSAVYKFTLNSAFPNAPTGLTVANSPVPNGNTANASWTFSDPDAGQTQAAYQFRWRRVGN